MDDTLNPLHFNQPTVSQSILLSQVDSLLLLSFPAVINLFYWWKQEQYIHTLSFAEARLAGSTVSGMLDWDSSLQLVKFTVFMK